MLSEWTLIEFCKLRVMNIRNMNCFLGRAGGFGECLRGCHLNIMLVSDLGSLKSHCKELWGKLFFSQKPQRRKSKGVTDSTYT